MTAIFVILIQFMFYTEVMNNPCPSDNNTVPVCTNGTHNYARANIPVNGSVGDGCICDVTLVRAESTGRNTVQVTNVGSGQGQECGYKVVNYNTTNNDSWTCSTNDTFDYGLSQNESFPLIFTRDATHSTGFCLYLKANQKDTAFTITCWRRDTALNKSNTSNETETWTPNATLSDGVIIGGAAGGACLLLLLVIVVVVCLVNRRKDKNYDKPSLRERGETCYETIHHDQPISMDNDLHVGTGSTKASDRNSKGNRPSTDMIYLENDMYVSGDSVTTTANFPSCRQGDVSVHSVPNNPSPTKRSPSSPDYTDIDDFPGERQDKSREQSTSNTAAFIVDKNQKVNNVYAVVNKKPKSGQTGVSIGDSPNQNSGNPTQTFSVAQSPNPNNVYAVVNKKPKVMSNTSKPSKPSKRAKTVKPPVAPKPKT
ncbi:hypothetical protein SNE40_017144 [Patella caerulea]|uniref:Uncharacterized protein n=1 Tax=Patella caerulea TaxID=87958 RepID=A0AAN8JBE5_PATCE